MRVPRPLPVHELSWEDGPRLEDVGSREWLVTNGVGGFASGTVLGLPTRRYHGYFVPALTAPLGRVVVLARLTETLANEHGSLRIDAYEDADERLDAPGLSSIRAFRLNGLLPEWEYALPGGGRLRKRLMLVHGQNTLHLTYRNESETPLVVELRPWWTFRMHEEPLHTAERPCAAVQPGQECFEVELQPGGPSAWARVRSPSPSRFVAQSEISAALLFRVERERGYAHVEVQRSPGHHVCTLSPGETLCFSVSMEGARALEETPQSAFEQEIRRQHILLERAGAAADTATGARLVLAADQFLIHHTRHGADETNPSARARNGGTVIAGYPWFTDWGRDTMIALEGLTLATGRAQEAASILRTFSQHVRDGLIPNLFPEGGGEGLYHTADATLWFFHALNRYLQATGEVSLLRELFPMLESVIAHHEQGTRFGIGVDATDGLLRQGAPGYQLTWMDAKVDEWVVTPRHGKAVEINALWFNALKLMACWAEKLGRCAERYASLAGQAQASFNRRFWNASRNCLFDVVDGEAGNDPSIRPNQLFAVSLDHPVLHPERWASVLGTLRDKLLTPVGLRTLDEAHPDYKPRYEGDVRARDGAYHQGTVWPWLLGNYVDACRRVMGIEGYGGGELGNTALEGLQRHLLEACVGQVSEIFDANAPHTARGCFAQAWSVAELLRIWSPRGTDEVRAAGYRPG